VTTYKLVAQRLGTRAYRAVGNALRRNRKPVAVPCHRVVSSDGSLGGYSGVLNNPKKAEVLRGEGIKMANNKIIAFESVLYRWEDKDGKGE
ncbi:MAG: MGMT family protein, partial [archaeon]